MKVSPHVSIYKFPVTAISSIATRLSGLYLSGAFVTIGISELMQNKKLYNTYDSLDNKYQKAINYSFILPTVYHTMGGIRHMVWDSNPALLNNIAVKRSSFLIIGLTLGFSYIIENQNIRNPNVKQS